MKRFIPIIIFLSISLSLKAQRCTSMDEMIEYARQYIGTPYLSGGTTPKAFDCSGFTQYCYKSLGIDISRVSRDQANDGIPINLKELKKGDLVFWKGSSKTGSIGHVGIVVEKTGNTSFDFIHASTSRGITISNSETSYYKSRYVTACRIAEEEESSNSTTNNNSFRNNTDNESNYKEDNKRHEEKQNSSDRKKKKKKKKDYEKNRISTVRNSSRSNYQGGVIYRTKAQPKVMSRGTVALDEDFIDEP